MSNADETKPKSGSRAWSNYKPASPRPPVRMDADADGTWSHELPPEPGVYFWQQAANYSMEMVHFWQGEEGPEWELITGFLPGLSRYKEATHGVGRWSRRIVLPGVSIKVEWTGPPGCVTPGISLSSKAKPKKKAVRKPVKKATEPTPES